MEQKDKMKGAGDLGSYCATKLFPTRITGVIVYVCIACCLLSYTTYVKSRYSYVHMHILSSVTQIN